MSNNILKINRSKSGEDFQKHAKKYVINMCKDVRTLHITNTKSCPHSKFLYEYIDANRVEDFKIGEDYYKKCKRCFPL